MPSAARLLLAAVMGLAVAGCGAVGGSPSPTLDASGGPGSTGPTSPASASPTSTSEASPTPDATTLSHPTGPADVLLRYAISGGYWSTPAGSLLIAVPRFSLLGDGTVLSYDPGQATDTAGAPLHRATMTEAQAQALLGFALDDGGLRTAADRVDPPGVTVSDAQTTVFTIDADGVDRTVQAYALDTDISAPGTTWAALQALAQRLSDVPALIADGGATDAGAFSPTAYRAFLLPGAVAQPLRDWPWPDIAPEDFKTSGKDTVRSTTLTPDQAHALAVAPGAGISVPVVGSDRAPYVVVLVPLLPDQVP